MIELIVKAIHMVIVNHPITIIDDNQKENENSK